MHPGRAYSAGSDALMRIYAVILVGYAGEKGFCRRLAVLGAKQWVERSAMGTTPDSNPQPSESSHGAGRLPPSSSDYARLSDELDLATRTLFQARCHSTPDPAFDPSFFSPQALARVEEVALGFFRAALPGDLYTTPFFLNVVAPHAPVPTSPELLPLLQSIEPYTFSATGSDHLKNKQWCQDDGAVIDSPMLKVVGLSDGVSGSPQSHFASQLLSRVGALAAFEVASEALELSHRSHAFASRLNARIVRKLWEALGALQQMPRTGIPLLGDATLGVAIVSSQGFHPFWLGDGYLQAPSSTYSMNDLKGRGRLAELFSRVTAIRRAGDPETRPRVESLLGHWPATVQDLLAQIRGALEGRPCGSAAAKLLSFVFTDDMVADLVHRYPLDPQRVGSEAPRMSAAFQLLRERGDGSVRAELLTLLATTMSAGNSTMTEARAFYRLAQRFVDAEARLGLVAGVPLGLADICSSGQRIGIWTDGVAYVDPEFFGLSPIPSLLEREDGRCLMRAEWLVNRPADVATEVVELWNRVATDVFKPLHQHNEHVRSQENALDRLASLGLRIRPERLPKLFPIRDDLSFAGFRRSSLGN